MLLLLLALIFLLVRSVNLDLGWRLRLLNNLCLSPLKLLRRTMIVYLLHPVDHHICSTFTMRGRLGTTTLSAWAQILLWPTIWSQDFLGLLNMNAVWMGWMDNISLCSCLVVINPKIHSTIRAFSPKRPYCSIIPTLWLVSAWDRLVTSILLPLPWLWGRWLALVC